jgi:hypothetical protein
MAQTQLNLKDQVGGSIAVRSQHFTGGGTSFTLTGGDTFAGSPMLMVFVGGALLKLTDDYTIVGNNEVVLNVSVSSGVIVTLQWFQPSFNLGSNATSLEGFSASQLLAEAASVAAQQAILFGS